jgi:signal transduction histidine kinase
VISPILLDGELSAILESVDDGIIVADSQGVRRANAAALKIQGFNDISQFNRDLAEIQSIQNIRREDGTPLDLSHNPTVRVLAGEKVNDRYLITNATTDKDILIRYNGVPALAGDGTKIAVITIQDITVQKELEEIAKRNEKLAMIGKITSSIAHEINNPLEAVTNLLYLIGQDCKDSLEYVNMAQQELNRVSIIVKQTLQYGRKDSNPTLTYIDQLLDSAYNLFRGRSLNIECVKEYSKNTEILCHHSELRQVFVNIIGNALDAMKFAGILRLRVKDAKHPKTGEMGVKIVIADKGVGMSQTTQDHIFDAFFSTKESTGSGLGLYLSADILKKHNAAIQVKSKIGSGTVFSIFIPKTN